MSKLFAIGDIHGHFAELTALMTTLRTDAGLHDLSDTVVFLGDFVDGGRQSRQVVDQLMAWSEQYPHWHFLKENHEDMMPDALVYNYRKYGFYDMWWGQGGRATAHSYMPENATDYDRAIMQPRQFIPSHYLEWPNSRPLTHEQDGYVFVHAGFAPRIGLSGQREEDMLWIRERFVNADWDFDGKRVVFGHTPFAEPLVMPNKIGIDTMLHDSGRITAVQLNTVNVLADPEFHFSPAVAPED